MKKITKLQSEEQHFTLEIPRQPKRSLRMQSTSC